MVGEGGVVVWWGFQMENSAATCGAVAEVGNPNTVHNTARATV